MAHIVMPDHLAIRRIEERDAKAPEIERRLQKPARIALRLHENIFRPQRKLLCLNNAKDLPAHAKCIIRRPASVGYSSTAQRSKAESGFGCSASKRTTFQPASFNLWSTICLRVTYSDFAGVALNIGSGSIWPEIRGR